MGSRTRHHRSRSRSRAGSRSRSRRQSRSRSERKRDKKRKKRKSRKRRKRSKSGCDGCTIAIWVTIAVVIVAALCVGGYFLFRDKDDTKKENVVKAGKPSQRQTPGRNPLTPSQGGRIATPQQARIPKLPGKTNADKPAAGTNKPTVPDQANPTGSTTSSPATAAGGALPSAGKVASGSLAAAGKAVGKLGKPLNNAMDAASSFASRAHAMY